MLGLGARGVPHRSVSVEVVGEADRVPEMMPFSLAYRNAKKFLRSLALSP